MKEEAKDGIRLPIESIFFFLLESKLYLALIL